MEQADRLQNIPSEGNGAVASKWKKRIGYGVGDLGCNLVFSTMASYLMIFYTDVFGISAAVAGTLMLVTKFIDALTDTGMGILVDRTHTKWGQGRPYFLVGAVPFAVFTIMTFFCAGFTYDGKDCLGLCDLLSALYSLYSGEHSA